MIQPGIEPWFSGPLENAVNIIVLQEFKLTYYEAAVQFLSHYAMGTPPIILLTSLEMSQYKFKTNS